MDKIFQRAEDKNVAAVIIYDGGDDKAYKDAACTVQFKTSELKNAYLKGAVIAIASNGGYATPTKYVEESSVGSVYFGEDALAAVADE